MKIVWKIDPDDVKKVQAFFDQHRESPFVKMRMEINLAESKSTISKMLFWERMVGCLLTTQQRSRPDSSVARFMLKQPFPLGFLDCVEHPDLAEYARTTISNFGGLRRYTTIGKELAYNLSYFEEGGWEPTFEQLDHVRMNSSTATERQAAEFLDEHLKGFGPKQSRNLLQALGLSRFEIPLDSRITKWLNAFGFPVKLTANALQDRNYYSFISDGFQRLCQACDIMPCILDAAIFASFDEGKWTQENVVW